ncbi:MAG TPA: carboxylating nicotinate-nucleotide diphosphorylase [Methylomirabilota bacterium]|nr:carboxylating nicotinate-nucleotide diphosphorylase [Methylomirabilota bacterium]
MDLTHAAAVEGLSDDDIRRAVEAALAEDVGDGDATTLALVPPDHASRANLVARESMRVAGLPVAEAVFRQLDERVRMERVRSDGDHAAAGDCLMRISGPTRALLTGERTALNFVQRLSGIATLTARFVEAVQGTNATILDTRKTTPGLRRLEKYAVKCGGGRNHRVGLFDRVLIKDNHLVALGEAKPNPVAAAVKRARAACRGLIVEVEADTLEQARWAVEAGADFILLDNMQPHQMREAVGLVKGRARTEASGGVNLQTVRVIAETGVDFISVGALTHSAMAVDVALDFESA